MSYAFHNYIWNGMSGLEEIEWFWGLDKFSKKSPLHGERALMSEPILQSTYLPLKVFGEPIPVQNSQPFLQA